MQIRYALSSLLMLVAVAPAPATAQDVFLFEDFDDGNFDPNVLEFGDEAQRTIGGTPETSGSTSTEWTVEPDAPGFDLEALLAVSSPASDETGGFGSYAWAAKIAEVPELAQSGFTLSVDIDVDAASADGANRSVSVGIAARCRYFFGDPPPCVAFSSVNRYYRLSYALVGAGDFDDPGAPAQTGELRLVEVAGDGQVDAVVDAIGVAASGSFELILEGTPLAGGALRLVGRIDNGVSELSVEGVDPTPIEGPGFGIRNGASVQGFGGARSNGTLDADFDDLLLVPEPAGAFAASCAGLALAQLRRARLSA
jgi:hypothetical protein